AISVRGLDIQTGAEIWTVPIDPSWGMSIMGPIQSGQLVFVGGYGMKSVLLELDDKGEKATEVYRGDRSTSLFPVNTTPILDGDYLYGVCSRGELRCVELKTGKRMWETLEATIGGKRPTYSAAGFLVKNGDRYFIFNEKGDMVIAKLTPDKYEEISRVHLL